MDYETIIQTINSSENFASYLGIRITEIREGYAKGEMEIREEFKNHINSVHGGCSYTLADTVAGAAAFSYGGIYTTISGNFNYLSPAMHTKKLIAVANKVKYGKTICVYDVEIRDDGEKLLAKGSFSYFRFKDK